MTHGSAVQPKPQKPLRLWPGIVMAVLLMLIKFFAPLVLPDAMPVAVLGGLASGLLIIIWWTFFSRLPIIERLGAPVLIALSLLAMRPLLHGSIAGAGMGMFFPILAIPILSLVLVGWAVVSRPWSVRLRHVTLIVTILLATACWTLIRTGGLNNEGQSDFSWRWSKSPEEELLVQNTDGLNAPRPVTTTNSDIDWPGFRGPGRDGIIRGTRIKPDWTASPPIQLWRTPIGPGWSSFAVMGNVFYTQEQRGEDEIVSCYNMINGAAVWKHREKTRFWESNAGAGPRATPTISNGRIYAFGATGILNVLQAADGRKLWSRNAGTDAT